jgi:hypothetical protein
MIDTVTERIEDEFESRRTNSEKDVLCSILGTSNSAKGEEGQETPRDES